MPEMDHVRTLLLFLATVAGCDSPPSEASLRLAADEQGLYIAFCRYGARCGEIGVSEEAACERRALALPKHHDDDQNTGFIPFHELEEGVASGRLAFDAQYADECLARVAAARCRSQTPALEDCLNAFHGTVAPGGGCIWTLDCANGSCPPSRACVARVGVDGVCQSDEECEAGLWCSSLRCVAQGSEGSDCVNDRGCGYGLSCVVGRCRSQGDPGAPCMEDNHCLVGLFCDGMPSHCAPQLPIGGACGSDHACQDGLVCVGRSFDPMTHGVTGPGTCVRYADVGEACDSTRLESRCPSDMFCATTSNTCISNAR